MSHAILTHSQSTPTARHSSSVTLQSILSQHANQPNSALSALIAEFNRITAQLSTAQARLSEFEANQREHADVLRSRNRLQDENRQLWTLVSKSKADLKDLKAENRELRHRLGIGSNVHPSGPLTPQQGVSLANTTSVPDLQCDGQAQSKLNLGPKTVVESRWVSESNHSDTNPPKSQPALKQPSLESTPSLLNLHPEPTSQNGMGSVPGPTYPTSARTDLQTQPSPSSGRLPSLSNTPLLILQPVSTSPNRDHPPSTPSPRLRRRASSVDMTRSPSSATRLLHPLVPQALVPKTTTTLPPLDISRIIDDGKDRLGNSHQVDALSLVGSFGSHIHYPDSVAVPSTVIHSVIPDVKQYILGDQIPISPFNLIHPHSPDQPVSSEPSTSSESAPTSSHMTSASVPNSSLSPSLSSHHALNTNPIIPVEQPLLHLKTAQSDSSQPASAFGPTSVSSLAPAPLFAPQRQSRPSNSPTQSQQGPTSNSGASVHSSSSTAPALPPTDTVYTTQPMTKRRMLTPTFLPFTHIKVTNSHIRANDKSKEVISFSITVSVVIPPESDPEGKGAKASWVVEKLYSDVLSLDHTVKSKHSKSQNRSLAQLPDRALFKDHAPSKVDARKAVLQKYLHSLCAAQLTEKADVCDFFNSNIVINERNSTSTRPGFMQGYLTKKGRNFGGWQTRFYVLEGPTLEYFDTRGGARLGHIAITGAQIGRQQYRSQEASDDSYRHAFLIRMHKREKEGEIDHILCAESDEERDAWVEALTCYVTGRYVSAEQAAAAAAAAPSANSFDNPRRESPGPAALPSDARLGKRETSLDNSIRSESTQSHNLHHQPSSSYDQPVRLHRSQHHPKVESLGQMSLASDGGPIRSTASTIVEEHDSVESSTSAMDSTSRAESGNRALAAYPEGREREQYTPRPPHLDVRASSYSHPVIPPGPSTPRPVASQPRLVSAQPHSSPQQDSLASDADSIATTSADRPSTPELQQRPKISGPMNGAPITGGYRIKPPEEKKAKFRSAFWGFTGRNGVTDRNNQNALSWSTGAPFTPAPRPVFGVSLQEAVSVARVHEGLDLPAVVFRCVEFLEAKGAIEEEGIYRLSGSSVNIKSYKERFNTEGDFNLLESSKAEYHDVHAVAGLLKQFLRELASPILTRELHPEFLKVIDLSQRSDKVNELGRLCAELPLPNYTLLRFLSAHLIHIVQNEKVNKMSMRNVGIVFSPTLGMPAPLFALLLKEFDLVFNIEGDNRAPIRLPGNSTEPSALQGPSDGVPSNGGNSQKRMSRNSMLYSATGADMLMEHIKLPRRKPAMIEDTDSDVDYDSASEPEQAAPDQDLTASAPLRERSPMRRRASLELHSPTPSPTTPYLHPHQRSQLSKPMNGILPPSPRDLDKGKLSSRRPRTAGP